MKRRPVIGLCGYARAGKDTMAKAVLGAPLHFQRFAFADELKHDVSQAMQKALNLAGRDADAITVGGIMIDMKEQIRPMLVGWGAGMRAVDPGHWIKRLDRLMRVSLTRPVDPRGACASGSYDPRFQMMTCRCIITDVRYKDEADWVRSLGGTVVWLSRPGIGPANDEECEKTKPDYCDLTLGLGGTIEENQACFRGFATGWLARCQRGEETDAETR